MTHSILVKNAKIPVGEDLIEGSILIEGRTIKAISKKSFHADLVIDAEGLIVVPGGIDIHAHVYDPEKPDHEDWTSGSLAALYGGITTLIDMPLRVFVDDVSKAMEKIESAARNSYVNYGVTGGFLNEKNYGSIDELINIGIRTFKIFTCRPFTATEQALARIFKKASSKGVVLIAHAEDEGILLIREEEYKSRNNIEAYHLSRDGFAEAAAIMKLGYYSLETGAFLHIAHLSSKEGVESLEFLKKKEANITVETCPHYLFFTREDSGRYGTFLKMAPTLKTSIDRESLWRALSNGVIDVYASDNAPSPRNLKGTDVWSAWGGIPNLEIMGPFLFTYGVLQRRISLHRFVTVFSRNPARLLKVYPRLGEIAVGSIADLVVLNTREPRTITARNHHHKVDWTPWEGITFYGHPYHVLVNGELVLEKGELVGKPGDKLYIGKLDKESIVM